MAITRLSLSSILNSPKYDSILANQQSLPSVPTIGTATDGGTGTTVNVAFTAGGIPGSSYTALSTPGSITATGTSSPITVSGLTAGTAYTFQVRATNNVGNSAYSAASNSVTPVVPSYTLALTANTTQNWTVPNTVSKIGVIVVGAGGGAGGGGGRTLSGGAGAGAGAGAAAAFYDYAVTPGTNYLITVGSAGTGGTTGGSGNSGAASSFGSIVTSNGGTRGIGAASSDTLANGGTATINISASGMVTQSGAYGTYTNPPLNASLNNAASNNAITLNAPGGPFNLSFGGGGGWGAFSGTTVGAAGTPYGGNGAIAGNNANQKANSGNAGANGLTANGLGGGGGGGGLAGINNVNGSYGTNANASSGGAGGNGRVLVYTV